ncbi:MAG: hypothetical protein HC936_14510, partial [Leptolyngbyaceae cyanobacterium SU_3_3]|nr:hypothetical protein [Leptolyngbyaceae cyanobacterium SU_3_3]
MTKTAWVFPGQGSQAIGMGLDLLDVPEIKLRFSQADRILGWSVSGLFAKTPTDRVSQTLYTSALPLRDRELA